MLKKLDCRGRIFLGTFVTPPIYSKAFIILKKMKNWEEIVFLLDVYPVKL